MGEIKKRSSTDNQPKRTSPFNIDKNNFVNCKKGCNNACSCRKIGFRSSVICKQCHGQNCSNIDIPEIQLSDDEGSDIAIKKLVEDDVSSCRYRESI